MAIICRKSVCRAALGMTLRLRPAHGELNDGGYDSQRSAFARHQTLSGRFTRAESSMDAAACERNI
jgi:competence protein ComEC